MMVSGNIESYIKMAQQYPMLSQEREQALAIDFKQNNNLQAAHELILSHLKYVISISRKYVGYGLPQDEIIQEGSIGLMKAVKAFDPYQGVRLCSFAMFHINSAIQLYVVKNWRLVKMITTKAKKKLFFNLRSMRTSHDIHGSMTKEEIKRISTTLNVPEEEVMLMEKWFNNGEMSIDKEDENDSDGANAYNYIKAQSSHEPHRIVEKSQEEHNRSVRIVKALSSLDDRRQHIIKSRWLCEDGEEKTFKELAIELGVSVERVSQLEKDAMAKIKKALS